MGPGGYVFEGGLVRRGATDHPVPCGARCGAGGHEREPTPQATCSAGVVGCQVAVEHVHGDVEFGPIDDRAEPAPEKPMEDLAKAIDEVLGTPEPPG